MESFRLVLKRQASFKRSLSQTLNAADNTGSLLFKYMHNRNTSGVQGGFQNFLFPQLPLRIVCRIQMRPSVLSLRFRSWSQSPKTCILYPNTFMPWKTGNSGHDRHRCRAKSCLFSLSHMQWKKFPDKADQHNTSFAPFSLRGSKSPLAYLTTQMP